jgi:type VI secretion system ImpM family protein
MGILGKVPWRGDFVRVRAADPVFAVFDSWLTENIAWAEARAGSGWPRAYGNGGVHAFVFRPPALTAVALAGALGPSHDGAERQFPLAVAALIDTRELLAVPEAVPIVLEELWQEASRNVGEIRTNAETDLERVSRELPAAADVTEAVASYRAWAGALPLLELWELVFGVEWKAAATRAVGLIYAAVEPQRGVERPQTPLTLRLPLGRAGGAAVCFWIDLVRRLCRWQTTMPSFFWSHDGNTGRMILHLGEPPRSTLAELWMPTGTKDEFCDLCDTAPAAKGGAPITPIKIPTQLSSHLHGEGPVLDLLRAAEIVEA